MFMRSYVCTTLIFFFLSVHFSVASKTLVDYTRVLLLCKLLIFTFLLFGGNRLTRDTHRHVLRPITAQSVVIPHSTCVDMFALPSFFFDLTNLFLCFSNKKELFPKVIFVGLYYSIHSLLALSVN